MMSESTLNMHFSNDFLKKVREQFLYIDEDPILKKERLFFDNAGGSLRLKQANHIFSIIDGIPDCSERNHKAAKHLIDIQKKGIVDLQTIFNVKQGSFATYLTASQAIFQTTGIIAEHIQGTNIVTTSLEHPAAYDAASFYANKLNKELRVAKSNPLTGGVNVEDILALIDQDTVLLSVIYASNISGAILDIEQIVQEARKKKPNLFIMVDAVQHAPHGLIDIEKTPVDVINFAPYKFFGVRGCGIAYLSERAALLPHHKLKGKKETEWGLGTPAPAHYAAISAIVDYVCWLGGHFTTVNARRQLFAAGMEAIGKQERSLLKIMLDGTPNVKGLREIKGVTVHLDDHDLSKRDFIVAISIEGTNHEDAVRQYEQHGVIVYERLNTSIYSKRMLDSFGMKGAIRISPLHCHTIQEIETFLRTTEMISNQHKKH